MIKIKKLITTPQVAFSIIFFISLSSLAAAFIAEGIFKIEPCILCIYQRYPFALAAIFSVIGLITNNKFSQYVPVILLICAVIFLTNSAIASYHTGVQQGWWGSVIEECSTVMIDESNGQSFLENIMSTPMAQCSKISWQDPVLGLSIANYNIALCFGLFLFCVFSALIIRKRQLL